MSFDYANANDMSVANLVHASGDPEEAKQEIKHWFSEQEIFGHEPLHKKFTR
jgi:nucleoside-diphosphate kinase